MFIYLTYADDFIIYNSSHLTCCVFVMDAHQQPVVVNILCLGLPRFCLHIGLIQEYI